MRLPQPPGYLCCDTLCAPVQPILRTEVNDVEVLLIMLSRAFPQLNLTVFADIANAAFGTVFDPPYDPFKDDISFLIATYIMEDVGVSGYLV